MYLLGEENFILSAKQRSTWADGDLHARVQGRAPFFNSNLQSTQARLELYYLVFWSCTHNGPFFWVFYFRFAYNCTLFMIWYALNPLCLPYDSFISSHLSKQASNIKEHILRREGELHTWFCRWNSSNFYRGSIDFFCSFLHFCINCLFVSYCIVHWGQCISLNEGWTFHMY